MVEPQQNITAKAVGSLKWSALMEVVSRTASPIVFVVLARLLTPADFGVMATAMIAISFSQMFWDAGLSKALIQTKADPEEAAPVVFWTNLVLGLLIYLLLFLTAPAIALFFKSPASGPVLRVLGIQIIIASLTSVHQALFVRNLDFRGLFWIKLFTAFIPALVSVPFALHGYGVWALVTGTLVGQTINFYILWRKSTWRPPFRYDWVMARSLSGFGFWVFLESLGAWLINWGDSLMVGRFLGIHDLGIYRTGWGLVTSIFGLALNPFLPVLYPTFSRLQDDLPALKHTFHRVNQMVFALVLPMGTGLLLLGSEMTAVLFGDKWQGLGFVLGILGLTYTISWLISINTELYRAMGRPGINTMILWVYLLLFLPSLYVAAPFGIEAFTITRLTLVMIGIPVHVYFCVRLLGVSKFYLWKEGKPMVLATMGMGVGISALKWGFLPFFPIRYAPVSLAIVVFAGGLVYLCCLWFLAREFVLSTTTLLKRVVAW